MTLGTLRDCFSAPPDPELVGRLGEIARAQPFWQLCAQAVAAEPIEGLADEWMRLFEGPGRIPAPLFGSFYLDNGLLMGRSSIAVAAEYRRHGVQPRTGGTPPDHLAFELGFLGMLTAEDGASAPGDRTAFARRYLGWLPELRNAVGNATSIAYFRELTSLAVEVVGPLAAVGSGARPPGL
ncbi:MAG: molecular chaperone TorD family protein [Candidatus Dormibacteraeota bacterium]|nr:molecular chaperone TorD family protein [Candidatus Dormibacteraeota bacterium]